MLHYKMSYQHHVYMMSDSAFELWRATYCTHTYVTCDLLRTHTCVTCDLLHTHTCVTCDLLRTHSCVTCELLRTHSCVTCDLLHTRFSMWWSLCYVNCVCLMMTTILVYSMITIYEDTQRLFTTLNLERKGHNWGELCMVCLPWYLCHVNLYKMNQAMIHEQCQGRCVKSPAILIVRKRGHILRRICQAAENNSSYINAKLNDWYMICCLTVMTNRSHRINTIKYMYMYVIISDSEIGHIGSMCDL